VRGLTASRCPECGVDFPTDKKTFRRWAVRRVAWDRVKRGGTLDSYLRTLFVVLFTPWRAGRALVVPDHWSRCVRWTVVHLMIAVVACAVLAGDGHMFRWVLQQVSPSSFDPPHMEFAIDAPAGLMLVWFSQSLAAWSIAMFFTVGLGVVLSMCIPGRRRAAKLGGVKWSLYLASMFIVIIAAWYGYYSLNPPQGQSLFPTTFTYDLPAPGPSLVVLAGAYGLWWAAGMAANLYNRKRGFPAFLGFALLYAGSWAIIAGVLFPLGPLDVLL
jgi:hypothetical protein